MGVLKLLENLRRYLIFVAVAAVARWGKPRAGDFHHPPIRVEDCESKMSWCAIFIGLDGRMASAKNKGAKISQQHFVYGILRQMGLNILLFHDDSKVRRGTAHVDPILLIHGSVSFIWGVKDILASAITF